MLAPEYIEAIERRLAWTKWVEQPNAAAGWERAFHGAPLPAYEMALRHGDLFVMTPKFCELVEAARASVPDDLAFELPWVLAPAGWIWFARPFSLPLLGQQKTRLAALSPVEQLATILMDNVERQHGTRQSAIVMTPEEMTLVREWVDELPAAQRPPLLALAEKLARGMSGQEMSDDRALLVQLGQAAAVARDRPNKFAQRISVSAMGWYRSAEHGPVIVDSDDPAHPTHLTVVSSGLGRTVPDVSILFYGAERTEHGVAYPAVGFTPLSHFGLSDGHTLGPRIAAFETWAAKANAANPQAVDAPYDDPRGMWRHEIRLAYMIFYLMAQKLAVTPRVETDRGTRRRAERAQQVAPPYIQVITLRRLEADRRRDPTGEAVDWQWRWMVVPHWRNQWYPGLGVHKRVLIASYLKGPADKPLKDPGVKLFVAKR